jgi:hypothetical protein
MSERNHILITKRGTPIRSPASPRKCSDTRRIKNVTNTGILIYDDTIRGFKKYASIAWTIAIIAITRRADTAHPYQYAMRRIGTPEINVPNTGIKPNTRTISERVEINGNIVPPCTKLIMRSPMLVRQAFVSAIRD